MKTCVVMQPTYLPWLGYFDLIDQADVFVFYNDVQYVKQSWQSRNRIITANGVIYISVPVLKMNIGTKIEEIEIDNRKPWKKKLLKTLFYTYQKTPFFKTIYPFFKDFFSTDYQLLSELNISLIKSISSKMYIDTKFYNSSQLSSKKNKKDARLVDISKELQCDSYLSTLGSASYIEAISNGGEFLKKGIDLYYHNFNHPKYNQLNKNFEPYMSIVDLLFNEGFENSLMIIKKGRKKPMKPGDIH